MTEPEEREEDEHRKPPMPWELKRDARRRLIQETIDRVKREKEQPGHV